MAMRLAVETLKAIDSALEADQGNRYRHYLGLVMPHIGDAYRQDEGGFRSHLGASVLGTECARAIYYGYRWVTKPKFSGRILRLFNRGHLEEARFIALLLMIGAQVYQQDANGKQYRISFANGHGGGSGDGIALGIPDVPPGTWVLLEFKTHGEKSFLELKKLGVRDAKFEHYVQMQTYMKKMGIAVALYGAVNKNTDELHLEIVTLDATTADQFMYRGEKIIYSSAPPAKLNESPGFWKCKFCDHRPVCHQGAAPEVNCRTCEFAKPSETSAEWICTQHDSVIPEDVMQTGCSSYTRNPVI